MRARSAGAALVIAAVVVVGSAGCTKPVEGEAIGTPAPVITYHPCEGFPPEAIRAAGINATTPHPDDRTVPIIANVCVYQSEKPGYAMGIGATALTLADLESDELYETLEDTTIGGHRALAQAHRRSASCILSIDITPGVLDFQIGFSSLEDFTTPKAACDEAVRVATVLAPYFPDHL